MLPTRKFSASVLAACAAVAEPLGVVLRDDGTRQWSDKGRPLHLFYADEKRAMHTAMV